MPHQLLQTENFNFIRRQAGGGGGFFGATQEILQNGENRTTFRDALIDGSAFLMDGDVRHCWLRECRLPLGPSGNLLRLVQSIKNMGKEESRGNAFHLGPVEPANTFAIGSPSPPLEE